MTDILGAKLSEMLDQPSFAYVFPEDVPAAQALFDAKGRGNANPFRFKLRRKDGSATWVDVQAIPMHNAEGIFKGIVGTFTVSGSDLVYRAKLWKKRKEMAITARAG